MRLNLCIEQSDKSLSWFQDDQFRREFDLSGYGREGGAGLKMGGGGELFKYEPREEKMMADNKM